MKDTIEYAKSARSSCKKCGAKIEKGNARIGRVSKGDGGFDMTRWYHTQCYVKIEPGIDSASVERLSGFTILKPKDKDALKQLAGSTMAGKRKEEEEEEEEEEGVKGGESKRQRVEGGAEEEEVRPVYGESKGDQGQVEAFDRAAWEKVLHSFSPEQLSSSYKGATLPAGWKAFQTVIIGEVGDAKDLSEANVFPPESKILAGEGVRPSEKIAAFDFDGCLANTSVRRHGADAWSLLYPTVPTKLQEYHEQGFKLVIFTNESNIDRFVKARQKAVDSKIGRLDGLCARVAVPIQVFIACAKSGQRDPSRKPGHGMWDLLQRHFNGGVAIDKTSSFFVGDAAGRPKDHSASDKEFAAAVGINFMVPEDVFVVR